MFYFIFSNSPLSKNKIVPSGNWTSNSSVVIKFLWISLISPSNMGASLVSVRCSTRLTVSSVSLTLFPFSRFLPPYEGNNSNIDKNVSMLRLIQNHILRRDNIPNTIQYFLIAIYILISFDLLISVAVGRDRDKNIVFAFALVF